MVLEENFWRQTAKIFWLRDGDLNTRFFHASTTCRSKINIFQKLIDEDAITTNDQVQIKLIVNNYFENLFKYREGDYELVVGAIGPCIMDVDNETLLKPFSCMEF